MLDINICTKADIDELLSVFTQSYQEHYTHYWIDHGEAYMKSNFNGAQLSLEMSNPNAVFFLIRVAQKSVGLIKLNIDSAIENDTAEASLELERIYFIKEASGMGFGTKAIDFVKDFAKQKGKKSIWLKTMAKSSVADFYKKQGFSIIGEKDLKLPNIKSDYKKMFIMLLKL